MKKLLRYLFIGILFPLLIQYVFYFQFTSNYTQDLFSEQRFSQFYGSSVYKSRQLGKELHLWVYHRLAGVERLKAYGANPYNSRRLLHLDTQADPVFYLTYFFIAAFFTVLTALLTLFLLDRKRFAAVATHQKDRAVCLLVLLIGMTQFVVTPYDTAGYFFQALGMLFFLQYLGNKRLAAYAGLLVTIAVATFNRETSLLLLSFMAAIYYTDRKIEWGWIKTMVLPVLCFVLPYLYLKLAAGGGASFTDQSMLSLNFNLRNPYSLMGLLFAAFAFYFMLVTNARGNRPLIQSFLVFSLPYLVIVFVVGMTLEYRLWMPLIQGAMVLSMLDAGAGTMPSNLQAHRK